MSVNPINVQKLATTYTTFEAAKEALKKGEISNDAYNALITFQNKNPNTNFYGVESNPDNTQLSDEEKVAKASNAGAKKEVEELQKLKMEAIAKNGVKTEEIEINSHGGVVYTADLKAPTKRASKHTYKQEQDRMARYYDEATGETITGEENLRAKRKEVKKAKKAAKKEAKKYSKEFKKAYKKGDFAAAEAAQKKVAAASLKRTEATEEYAEVKQAHKAAKGYGIEGDTRAYNRNAKANNRLYDREVFYTEADAKAFKKQEGTKDIKAVVASKDDVMVLRLLSATAQRHLDAASSPNEKALWGELAGLFKDKDGKDIPFTQLNTQKVQDALIDLTGGDMRLNYTEQKMISAELGVSMHDVRHAFKTYGFEAPNPLGKRVENGLKDALPVAATMGLSYLLTRSKSHAESHAESSSHAEATNTVVVQDSDVQPGKVYTWIDPETGEEIHERIKGAEAYAEAIATAKAEADAFASATAVAEAVAVLSPAALAAAPALAFLTGFVKMPVEKGAAKAGATTQKMATYVETFKKNKNKNIGNQIIQMAGQITGNKEFDRALIVAVLDHDIGSQNTNPRTRELRNALAHLDAIKAEVDKMKKVPPPPEPTPAPTEAPACEVDINKEIIEIKHNRKAGDTWGGIVNAYYPDCVKVHGERATIRALKEALATGEDGVRDEAKFKALLRGTDIPKLMKLPMELMDCEINKDGEVEARKFRKGGKSNNMEVGHGNTRYGAQDCDNRNYKGKTAAEVEESVRKNNAGKKINIHVNE